MQKITSNGLKVIAIICMILDHFAYYYRAFLPFEVYMGFRIVGRIAMPIFAFLLVQGYLHTKDVKKYMIRLLVLAIMTQIGITGIGWVGLCIVPSYVTSVIWELNIVFSLCLSLCVLCMLDERKKIFSSLVKDVFMRCFMIFVMMVLYLMVPIDYGIWVPFFIVGIYGAERIIRPKSQLLYRVMLAIMVFITLSFSSSIGVWAMLAVPFLLCYNGTLGKKSEKIKALYYLAFPLQHLVLFFTSLVWYFFTKMN